MGHSAGQLVQTPLMEPSIQITPEKIRERARELWERNHYPEGLDLELWLLAEREIRSEMEQRNAPSNFENGS